MSGVCDPSGDALTFPSRRRFDTANRYGRKPGETETIIGNWFATGGGRRERTFIATSAYGEMGAEPGSWLSGLAAYRARGQRTDHRSANS
jgi:aryl-alcohol dehydrogenase-like predicted oxidoreductase